MTTKNICAFICVLLLASSHLQAQTPQTDTARVMGIQYQAKADDTPDKPVRFFNGVGVVYDLCGTVMALATPFGQYEVGVRANLKEKYFPVVELGLGHSDHEDEDTHFRYKTSSPYFRVGMDYNLLRASKMKSRVMVGLRFGYSPYKFDLTGPDVTDPVYGYSLPVDYKGLKANMLWTEIVAGAETRIWKCLHLGWSVRYKIRLHEGKTDVDNAWYVPGYGRFGGSRIGGTFNVIIEI